VPQTINGAKAASLTNKMALCLPPRVRIPDNKILTLPYCFCCLLCALKLISNTARPRKKLLSYQSGLDIDGRNVGTKSSVERVAALLLLHSRRSSDSIRYVVVLGPAVQPEEDTSSPENSVCLFDTLSLPLLRESTC